MSIFNTGINPFKTTKVIPVFLTITDDYAKYAAVCIRSLTRYANKKRNYRIIIMHDHLSFANRVRLRNLVTKNCAIEFHKMKYNLYMRVIMKYCSTKTGSGDFYSSAVYLYRSFIARMFMQYDKAIYIDADTLLMGDIGKLYDIDLGENAVAARVDPKVAASPEFTAYVEKALGVPATEYVNSGVLLMNLRKLRKLHYITRMTDLMKEYDASLVAPDQDYLNIILMGKILHLPAEWNAQFGDEMSAKGVKLLHFNLSKKPWFHDDVEGGDLFWRAAKGSGFYSDLKRGKEEYTLEEEKKAEAKIKALVEKAAKMSKMKEPIFLAELPKKEEIKK